MTDFPDWNNEAAAAAAIASGTIAGVPGGVPLLTGKKLLQSGTQVIGAGNTFIMPNVAITQPGWELALSVTGTAGTTATITINWLDSVTGLQFDQDTWAVTTGYNANPHVLYGVGRARGDIAGLSFTAGTFAGITVTWSFIGTTFAAVPSDLRTITVGGGTGGISAGGNHPDQLILTNNQSAALAVNGAYQRALPLYAGLVQITAETTSGATDLRLHIDDLTGSAGNYGKVYDKRSDSHGIINDTVYLPRYQCGYTMIQLNAANQTLSIQAVIAQPSS
jgi:hypothetical protein